MKKTILKSMMAVLVALSSLSVYAYDVEIDGIYYKLNTETKEATVTYLYEVYRDNQIYRVYSGGVVIPESIEHEGVTYRVTSIDWHTFNGCSYMTSITIPNSVTSIGGGAFNGCSGLTSIDIPNSVINIGSEAFNNCNGLTSITIPNSVTSIGYRAFSGCDLLSSVNITDLTAWCKISFEDHGSGNPLLKAHHLCLNGEEIKDLVIPNNVTSIGKYAFYGCSDLTSITIPESVTEIGEYNQEIKGETNVEIIPVIA